MSSITMNEYALAHIAEEAGLDVFAVQCTNGVRVQVFATLEGRRRNVTKLVAMVLGWRTNRTGIITAQLPKYRTLHLNDPVADASHVVRTALLEKGIAVEAHRVF